MEAAGEQDEAVCVCAEKLSGQRGGAVFTQLRGDAAGAPVRGGEVG